MLTRDEMTLLTTEAPSPRTALSAKSGTGSHEGRAKTCPSCSHNSDNRTGFGAVPFITPNTDIHKHDSGQCNKLTS